MDVLDVEVTIQMVKGIYMYRKDDTVESMIRTRWLGKNRFNPIETRRLNTQEVHVSDLDTINECMIKFSP